MARNSDGTVYIDTLVDTKGFGKGMNSMKSQLGGLTGSFKKLGIAIGAAFAIKQLVQFGQKAIELGSDLQEVQNVVDVTFTTMSEKVNEFAKGAAEAAGLSETMAKRYVGTFGAMAKAFGFAESEAFDMSTSLTQLAGDVASFYNLTQDEAYTKLKSVFTGETESLKDLGVVMTQSALDSFALAEGLGKTTKQMSEQEKVALRYRFVMNQLSTASGDFLRTSDSWANQTRLLKLNLESIMATFGQGLINFFTPVIKLINTLLSKIATLANAFKAFSEMIMGTSSGGGGSGTEDAAESVGKLTDGYNNAAEGAENLEKANEKASRSLSKLDKLNVIQSQKESSSDLSGGGIGGQAIDFGKIDTEGEKTGGLFDKLIEKAKELADIFKAGFFDGLGDFSSRIDLIKDGLNSIKESLIEIFTDSSVVNASKKYVKSLIYMFGQITGAIASIGLTIGANLIGGLALYLESNEEKIKEYLTSMFDIEADINTYVGDWVSSIAYIFEAWKSEGGLKISEDLIGIFASIFMSVTELGHKFTRDMVKIFMKPISDSKEELRKSIEDLLEGFSGITEYLRIVLEDTGELLNEIYDQYFAPFFSNISDNISKLLKENISPMISELGKLFKSIGEALTALWEGVFKPFIDWLIDKIMPKIMETKNKTVDIFSEMVASISDLIKGLFKTLRGIIDFIVGVFTRDWKKAWNGIKTAFSGIWESLETVMKNPINGIIGMINKLVSGVADGINLVIRSINSLDFDIPDWVPQIGGEHVGFNLKEITPPKIPYLASGAVIPPNAPFMAMLGDQRNGKNLEAPEGLIRQIMREELSNIGVDVTFKVEGDPNGIFKVTQKKAREYKKRTGQNAYA